MARCRQTSRHRYYRTHSHFLQPTLGAIPHRLPNARQQPARHTGQLCCPKQPRDGRRYRVFAHYAPTRLGLPKHSHLPCGRHCAHRTGQSLWQPTPVLPRVLCSQDLPTRHDGARQQPHLHTPHPHHPKDDRRLCGAAVGSSRGTHFCHRIRHPCRTARPRAQHQHRDFPRPPAARRPRNMDFPRYQHRLCWTAGQSEHEPLRLLARATIRPSTIRLLAMVSLLPKLPYNDSYFRHQLL